MSYNEDNLVNLGHLKRVAQIAHDYHLIIPTLTVSNTELTITQDHSNTITFTTDSDGVITITSDDDTIATATINSGTITVDALAVGNTTLTLSIAPTATYRAISETINVVVAAKPVPELTLSDTDIEVTAGDVGTVTVTTNSTGAITVTSGNVNKATASISGTTITITGVVQGSTTVTVSIASTVEYASRSATISVTVTERPADLESHTWAEIKAIGAAGTGDTYFDVGDTKTITLNGTVGTLALSNFQCKVFIIDFNYNGANGIYFQGFKTTDGIDIALCDSKYKTWGTSGTKNFNMNHTFITSGSDSAAGMWGTNYGGWKGTDLRYDILGSTNRKPSRYNTNKTTSNVGYDAQAATVTSPVSNTLMAALPSDLRSAIAAWTIYTDNTGNKSNVSSTVTTSIDYLPLLSDFEVQGSRKYANQYEQNQQAQMTYYKNGNSKVKYRHDNTATACQLWLRSPSIDSTYRFCVVQNGGSAYYNYAAISLALSPAFRIS